MINTIHKRLEISTKTFSGVLIVVLRNQKISSALWLIIMARNTFSTILMLSAYRYFVAPCLFHSVLYSVRILYPVRSPCFIRTGSPHFPPGPQSTVHSPQSTVHSHLLYPFKLTKLTPLWGGALRDETKNGCEGD